MENFADAELAIRLVPDGTSLEFYILNSNIEMTKVSDSGCVPNIEPEVDSSVVVLKIVMISLVVIIVILVILLIFLVIRERSSKSLPIVVMESFV